MKETAAFVGTLLTKLISPPSYFILLTQQLSLLLPEIPPVFQITNIEACMLIVNSLKPSLRIKKKFRAEDYLPSSFQGTPFHSHKKQFRAEDYLPSSFQGTPFHSHKKLQKC